ncbi:MAG: ribonuclease H-like domain-containing protein [Vicinamibacterales bacterium]
MSSAEDIGGALPLDAEAVARALGGEVRQERSGAFIQVDRTWDATDFHGSRRVSSFAIARDAPVGLFDPRLAEVADWPRRPVFFDIETTGLSGGAGTVAFLVGCGWFEDDGFRVRQFLLTGPASEPAMLDALGELFDEASLLVTYNGRTFDVPTMETRWAFHRRPSPADELPHFDMLPAARRLWGRRAPRGAGASSGLRDGGGSGGDEAGCSLTALERSVLRFHRVGDVPGFEIPVRYFQFLRTGHAEAVRGVLEHNQYDLVSLAAVTAHALQMAADGPETCREAIEQGGLGRLYERAGDLARAERAFVLAAESDDVEVAAHALARLGVLWRRAGRHGEAAGAWQRVLRLAERRLWLRPLARRAAEALAIHHEHRAGDPDTARGYAEALRRDASGRAAEDARHRLARLDRKIKSAGDTKGGPSAAQLFES